jgi:iron complex transport system permease protein
MESKLPRAVLGTGVGAALGLAGAIFQTTLRNELASPDIVGVTLGASAAAVFGIVILGQDGPVISALAVAGALGVALLVRALAQGQNGYRLVLLGIGISAVMQAVIQYLFTRVDEFNATKVLQWLGGSLSNVEWRSIGLFYALVLPVLAAIAWQSRVLRVAELGDDLRAGLGAGSGSIDLLMALAVILAGLATAVAGPVAFVAFLSGPISRALTGGRTRLVPAALVGAVLVVLGDHIGAYLLGDVNLPVGIITGALGAPALIWLIATGATTRGSR